MSQSRKETIIAGYIPLLDSALLVAAARLGFAEEQNIELKLVRETSWANIRDRIAVGHFDVAHMLGPMPIAASLNITSLAVPMQAAMTLGLGGNAITVSNRLWDEMKAAGVTEDMSSAEKAASLKQIVGSRKKTNGAPLRFAVVHPFSGHAYELRYWLASAGVHPDRDIEINILPPTLMPDALSVGQIDGYCVGEPWNTVAVQAGTGRIVTHKQEIWPSSPEKVLGVTRKWAAENPDLLTRLIRALVASADWCGQRENLPKLASLLAAEEFLNCDAAACLPALTGELLLAKDGPMQKVDFLTLSGTQALMPRAAHGLWLYSQMVRWGQADYEDGALAVVRDTYSSDLFRTAMDMPPRQPEDVVRELTFFDGGTFELDRIDAYIQQFPLRQE